MAEIGIATQRLSTDEIPMRERVDAWREFYGRSILRLEVEPLGDVPFRSHFLIRPLPGLGIVFGDHSPLRVGRTPGLLVDGDDGLTLQVSTERGAAAQLNRELDTARGDAVLFSNADRGHFTFPVNGKVLALRLPRAALTARLREGEDAIVRPVPRANGALRLLKSYLRALPDDRALEPTRFSRFVVDHVYDLVALALGAKRDAAEWAIHNGLRAARLHALKSDAHDNLAQPGLSAAWLARRHGITPRYVQMLFEAEGHSFSSFLRMKRLAYAHRMLCDPSFEGQTIARIAFNAGFGDLSHFNHVFRRFYGASPSEVRRGPG